SYAVGSIPGFFRVPVSDPDEIMKIAQVAPLYESVPPPGYGGTERVVSWLTEELVRQGHDVTLFASGDSITDAQLVAVCPKALRTDPDCRDQFAHHVLLLEQVRKRSGEFDIVHFHVDYLHFPVSRQNKITHLTTLHGRLDIPDLVGIYEEFSEMPVVSISKKQREPLDWINWVGNVYHGLPENQYSLHPNEGRYLAFIGRISPEKRPDRVIEIATAARIPVKIAAKIDRADREYFENVIKPLLDNPLVEFIGEIGDAQKNDFLGNALACLFPIDWPEPFGLTMIEAMACGTPTIAFRNGSVPEIIQHGVNGFIVDGMEAAIRAVERLPLIDRRTCRAVFEKRFTSRRMASDYLRIYEQQIARGVNRNGRPAAFHGELKEGRVVSRGA
ncbi:MAG: glycosyltransferase family 4 protein, partial [Blastocatellia bacterium]